MHVLIRKSFQIAIVIALSTYASPSTADTTISSTSQGTNLVELYTSEGCSSCPPADRWLATLKDHPALWTEVIPLAFHVDYWDYIGWKDRFAQPEFADRQRRYAAENGMATIYTPGLISNGKEWRNFSWQAPTAPAAATAGLLVAHIGADELDIRYQPLGLPATSGKLIVNTALLGFGLSSEIDAGENAGRELRHDFVVLEYEQSPLQLLAGTYQTSVKRRQPKISADRYAIAIWISNTGEQAPLQAVGGWLD